jgi:hypothetical protein
MRRVIQLSLLAFVLSVIATAQSNYANLSGTVFDPQQKAVAGCTVQLTSETTGASRQTVTNDLGQFQITGVLPGDFNLLVQSSGFATINQKIRLEVGQSMTVELSLKLATLNTVVDVSEDSVNL